MNENEMEVIYSFWKVKHIIDYLFVDTCKLNN